MRKLLFPIFLFLFALSFDAAAQTISLRVNGINIGASYQNVLQRFGEPVSNRKRGTNPCGGTKLTLRYRGLIFTLDDADGYGQGFTVVSIETASPKY